jgi:formin 2/WAS/WASL-interacting protein
MGFMDKAKKLAEQAQTKLDEAQQQFNKSQGNPGAGASSDPAVEYDKHGRPVPSSPPEATTPPHGDPLGGGAEQAPPPPPPPQAAPTPDPAAPPPSPPGPAPEDPDRPSHEPPKLSGGDPLAG